MSRPAFRAPSALLDSQILNPGAFLLPSMTLAPPTAPSARPLRVAILGTRGIPNRYGGFEQFAEYLALGLQERGHEVAVYLPHTHPYAEPTFRGVTLHRVFCPEAWLGAAAHFLYDYLCLRDAVRRGCDIALECGYQSAAISYRLGSLKRTGIVTNMDGLEWNRAKWSPLVRRATKWFESLAVRHSHALVADNVGIQTYLQATYGAPSHYIPYGAEVIEAPDPTHLEPYAVKPLAFHLLIARLEPENHIEMILEGHQASGSKRPFLVVGHHETPYGRHLQARFGEDATIRFVGGIYQKPVLDALRRYAYLYFHGHSVGGTNPSLLEAMACGALIVAHDNAFNRAVIGDSAHYVASPAEIAQCIALPEADLQRAAFTQANQARIRAEFGWPAVVSQYEDLFQSVAAARGDRP